MHSVGARTAAVFVCEAAYLFAVHQQFDGTVIEVEDYFSRLLRGEYALIRGGEVGQVTPERKQWLRSTETERVVSREVAAGAPLNSVLFQ